MSLDWPPPFEPLAPDNVGPPGPAGPQGEPGPPGPQGEPGPALPVMRHRATRADAPYPVGVTNFVTYDATPENEGGITQSAGVFTVPEAATYALTLVLNPTAAWGTACTCGGSLSRRGGTVFLATQALQNTSVAALASWTTELAAGDTVQFSWTNGSAAAVTMSIEAQVAKVGP